MVGLWRDLASLARAEPWQREGGRGGHLGMGQAAHRMGFGFVRNRLALDGAAQQLLVAVAKSVALLS